MTAKYWLLTDFNVEREYDLWTPQMWAVNDVRFSKGQLERCASTGRLHWQFVIGFNSNKRLTGLKALFGNDVHAEITRSAHANEYVHKIHTSEGRRWQFGNLPTRRNNAEDWEKVWKNAVEGNIADITASIRVQHYNNLKRIQMDHMKPLGVPKEVYVFWGPTGTGKSKKAWEEAGLDAYPKSPTTKFWDGYQGQENVVIDEFFGQIEISHMLRWLDRYPVCIETKGSGTVLKARRIWITSNIDPRQWYLNASAEQQAALKRRMQIVHWPMVRRFRELTPIMPKRDPAESFLEWDPIARDEMA